MTEIDTIRVETIDTHLLRQNKGQVQGVPRNPRAISDTDIERLKTSLSERPWMLEMRPVLVYQQGGTYVVLAGNQRLRAARALGMRSLPSKVIPAETDAATLRRITLLDNSEAGVWDYSLLDSAWEEGLITEFGLSGWQPGEDAQEGATAHVTGKSADAPTFDLALMCTGDERDAINSGIATFLRGHKQECDDIGGNRNKNANALYLIVKQWAASRI